MYLVVDFDFMNERSVSNNSNFRNRFVIPNENTITSGANQIMKYHLKSNYIGRLTGTEKGSIRNITARFMNEDGEVNRGTLKQLSINTGTLVTFQSIAGATITTSEIVEDIAIHIGEQIFSRDGTLIGTVSSATGADIVLTAAPTIVLIQNEPLYYKAGRTEITVNGAILSGVTTISVDKNGGDASVNDIQSDGIIKQIVNNGVIIQRGAILYTPEGYTIGEVTNIAINTITIGNGTEVNLANNTPIYILPSMPVFHSNSKSNRVIMELIFRERKESILTSN